MAENTKKKAGGAGLRGQSAGETKLCTVGKTGSGLTYNGYDVADLAENATFYETAYLIFHGELPNQAQLDEYSAKIKANRALPDALKKTLEMIPKETHPMDVMRMIFHNNKTLLIDYWALFLRLFVIGINSAMKACALKQI